MSCRTPREAVQRQSDNVGAGIKSTTPDGPEQQQQGTLRIHPCLSRERNDTGDQPLRCGASVSMAMAKKPGLLRIA
jgi:hypothetical protein